MIKNNVRNFRSFIRNERGIYTGIPSEACWSGVTAEGGQGLRDLFASVFKSTYVIGNVQVTSQDRASEQGVNLSELYVRYDDVCMVYKQLRKFNSKKGLVLVDCQIYS